VRLSSPKEYEELMHFETYAEQLGKLRRYDGWIRDLRITSTRERKRGGTERCPQGRRRFSRRAPRRLITSAMGSGVCRCG
jgi:hypothetical protein